MKKTAIIKTGDTDPALAAPCGDFEDWIMAGLGLDDEQVMVVDVARDQKLPSWNSLAGVVITGSHAMVTDERTWSLQVEGWLPEGVARQIPILGICYGHQLLARAMGGRVGDNPRGMEYGTVPVELYNGGEADPLLGHLANPLHVHVCHNQTVFDLPPGANLLARSAGDCHQAFRIGGWAWGLQFHPEFDARAMAFYIRQDREPLTKQGLDVDQLLAETRDTPWGDKILKRFGAFAQSMSEFTP